MERTFTCTDCRKKLEFFETHRIPGRTIVELDGFTYDTSQTYCEPCFKQFTKWGVMLRK